MEENQEPPKKQPVKVVGQSLTITNIGPVHVVIKENKRKLKMLSILE